MFKHKRRYERILHEPPITRNKINESQGGISGDRDLLNLTDTQGFKLAYETKDGIYRNGSILYIAGTKDPIDFYDDMKLPLYQARNTKRYKDVDKFIEDGTIEIDGKKHTGITDVISPSLGSAVGQQINNEYCNIFRSRSYGSPFISGQRPEDTGTNLRVRGSNDVVSMCDHDSKTIPKGSLNALYNHSYEDIANLENKAGNNPLKARRIYGAI